jgi:hypothetical protein
MDCHVNIYIAASHYTDPHYSINDVQDGTIQAYMFDRMNNRNMYDTQRNTNKGMNNLFLEIFTQACAPSFNGFDTDGNYRFDVAEVENYDTIKEVHRGILDFATLYLEKSEQYPYLRRISGYDAYCPFRFIIRDPKFIKETFADFTEARGVGGSKTNYRIEKLSEIWKQVNL